MNFIQLETVFQRLLRIPDKYTSFNFFKQENLNRQFVNSGFVVVDLPDLDVVIELYQASLGLDKEGADGNQDTGFQNTSFLDNQEKRSKVQSVLLSFSSQLFSTFLNPELQIEAGSFFTKKAKSPSEVGLHHDGCHIDESTRCGMHIWIPLSNSTKDNGTMQVIPYSHRLGLFKRVVADTSVINHYEQFLRSLLKPIELKKGQVLFFDHALIHLSGSNLTDEDRLAASFTVSRRPYQYIYYYPAEKKDWLNLFHVNREFWVDSRTTEEKIQGLKPVKLVKKPSGRIPWFKMMALKRLSKA